MKLKPVDSFPKFSKAKLGTTWLHLPTKQVYELRRYTDPKTLKGTLFLYNRENAEEITEVVTRDWKQT